MNRLEITLPLSVVIPRKTKADKVFYLNLNQYRNTHFQVLNQVKILFKSIVEDAARGCQIDREPPFSFTYTIHPANKRKFDLTNVGSVVDKFTCDALTELGIITDDSCNIIKRVIFEMGEICPDNPHCILKIEQFKVYRILYDYD